MILCKRMRGNALEGIGMIRNLKSFAVFVIVLGCIEPYEFVVRDEEPGLVVEAFISDKSFNETLSYPSDGRYFTVKLSLTGDVTNVRPVPVTGAQVELEASNGQLSHYTEDKNGLYVLRDKDFKALAGVEYKLRIVLPDESVYESKWESLPEVDVPPMGEIGFIETEKEVFVLEATKWVVKTKQFATATITLPENTTGERIHYRWTFSPTWIYVAPLAPQHDPAARCWATDPLYLNSFTVQSDHSGGYAKNLFDIETVRNVRIYNKFSVLVTQQAMTEPYFSFWNEMKERNEQSALLDRPPFNLETNFSSSTGDKKVSGYFGVTTEQARRWYFDRTDLSYYVEDTMLADCQVVYGPDPPAPECFVCTEYSFGNAVATRPSWWQQ